MKMEVLSFHQLVSKNDPSIIDPGYTGAEPYPSCCNITLLQKKKNKKERKKEKTQKPIDTELAEHAQQ